ncbi:MAG: DNA polymerase I [Deltaproteobacteria bacterium]|nr:DNA polymerase I [Deltaproteobacteria bacterium]
MKPLYLIDGHNLLYRAFFALPRLTAPDGRPTHVVFGFARVLLKILREENPGAVAAVFDSREPTPRHALYPAYKANRLKQPEELASQIPLVKEVIDALGIPRLEVPGVEADDIIGTLARMAEGEGREVVIISSDKDLYQLVSSKVRIRDGIRERSVGEEEVRETFGVGPGQVVDLLALAGDPSDNVPGVPGVGEKTAAELIREFGSLEGVLAGTDRLKGAKREKIEKNVDQARLCRDLVRIDRSVPLDATLESLRPKAMAKDRVAALFRELGFRKLLDELDLAAEPRLPQAPAAPPKSPAWMELSGAKEIGRFLVGVPPARVAIALPEGEATPFAGLAAEEGKIAVFPAAEAGAAASAIARMGIALCVFDGKAFLRRTEAVDSRYDVSLFDLQVAAYLLAPDEGTPGLRTLRERFLRGAAEGPAGGGPKDEAARGAGDLLALGRTLAEKLEDAGLTKVFREVDMPLLPVLLGMEEKGIRIDPPVFRALSGELAAGTREIERKVCELAGTELNINSPKQLAFLLFEKLGLPTVRRTKTGFSTDVDVLEQIKGLHPIPGLVLEYRTLAKIKSTYVDVLPDLASAEDGRIHTTFHQTQTATGRLSSSDPNLQNIPIRSDLGRRIRAGFVAGNGCVFVGADYSQVELRLLAHLSGSEELIRTFRAGEDIHAATACRIFGISPGEVTPEHRRKAKVINFGILYGMSPFGLSRELGIGGKEAKRYIEQYFERYPGVRAYIDGVVAAARKDGYVQTIMGRRRTLRDINSRNRVVREAAERMAVNAPIQGSAADLIKLAMIRADREFRARKMGARLILQVHDELIAETPEAEGDEAARLIKDAMEGVAELSIPLTVTVSIGKNWGEIH